MPEPFKNRFSIHLIHAMSAHIAKHFSNFDQKGFNAEATLNLESLALKARSLQITTALQKHLPIITFNNIDEVSKKLIQCLTPLALIDEKKAIGGGEISHYGIEGWAIMPLADYIAFSYLATNKYNDITAEQQAHIFTTAMSTLKEMTKRFTTEFAIRYLIQAQPKQAIALLTLWLDDDNYHVRRLISEGSRPRLPWGIQLNEFITDPSPLLPLLEALKDDEQLYVRRSVANNMNDIAKDHPELVATQASSWLKKENKQRLQLVKHACRTLIKKGNLTILTALGFKDVDLKSVNLLLSKPALMFGESIALQLTLVSNTNQDQKINIDYQIHHQKANGTTSPKVFKWKAITLKADETLNISKKHTIKHITTRTYYPGVHKVDILVNGRVMCSNAFDLLF